MNESAPIKENCIKSNDIKSIEPGLTSKELLAAYFSHEQFMAEIIETCGNMKDALRMKALLVIQALELGDLLDGRTHPRQET